MIIQNPVSGLVVSQPISPAFGQQFSGTQAVGAPITQLTSGAPLLAQVSNGSVPLNQLVNSVNGVSASGNPFTGGDPCTVAQALSNGNGAETARGASTALNGAIAQQVFVDGIASAIGPSATGPTADNTSSLSECPVSAATLCQNVVLFPHFGG